MDPSLPYTYLCVASAIRMTLFPLPLKLGDAPPPNHRKIKYRSFKNFDEDAFGEAVGVAPFEVAYVFDDVDDIYPVIKYVYSKQPIFGLT